MTVMTKFIYLRILVSDGLRILGPETRIYQGSLTARVLDEDLPFFLKFTTYKGIKEHIFILNHGLDLFFRHQKFQPEIYEHVKKKRPSYSSKEGPEIAASLALLYFHHLF